MTPERWKQIEEIYQQALDLPEEARFTFLEECCKSDPGLRNEVESLLQQKPGNTMDRAVLNVIEAFSNEPDVDAVGRRIGPYKLTRLIGQGGMGAVYEAVRDDDEFQKKVAIKLIRRGMDSDLILKRFRYERQILAALEHPNIARLLDGGTTEDGLPFFVMEYIDGSSLTQYAAANDLSLQAKLKMFRMVCEAVQHAHRNLIVHRDIKPGNILVTGDGTPKLLDFGIAKLLHPDAGDLKMTQTMGTFPMLTPDYASPEQIRGETVSTATDIYSLGVVLYELLTGRNPFEFKSVTPQEIVKLISDTQPERPSILLRRTGGSQRSHKQLAGDLDNIVLMALRKEPERRYRSVEQFSEDIRRHLERRPVIARKDTIGYRAGKFIGRHKLTLGAVALIIVSLVAGIIVSVLQARRADNEAQRAQQRFEQVRMLANTFLFDFHEKIRDLPGSTEAREMVVKTALQYLDNLAQEADNDPQLLAELSTAYQKVGDVQGNPWAPNLGHPQAAMQSYRKGLLLAEKIAEQNKHLPVLRTLASGYFKLGALQSEAGEKANAGKTLLLAKNAGDEILRKSSQESDLILMSDILTRVGDVQLDSGDAPGALQTYLQMQKLLQKRAAMYPSDAAQAGLATSHSHVGESQASLGDLDNAIASYRQALELLNPLVQKRPDDQAILRFTRVAHTWLGHLSGNPSFINKQDTKTAVHHFQEAVAISEKMTVSDPKNARAQQDLAIDLANLGDVLSLSDPKAAEKLHRRAAEITEFLLKNASQNFLLFRRKSYFSRGLASDLANQGDVEAAITALQESRDILEKLVSRDPSNMVIQRDLHLTLCRLGALQLRNNEFDSALRQFTRALQLAEQSSKARPRDLYALWELADSHSNFGKYYEAVGDPARAIASCEKSLELWNQWPSRARSTSFDQTKREKVLSQLAALRR